MRDRRLPPDARMAPKDPAALLQKFVEGMPRQAVYDRLGVSKRTLENYLYRTTPIPFGVLYLAQDLKS